MPLVEAKCTKCGAALTVDDSKEAMVCQYCGEAFIVEKAINNYNINNNIQAGVVNVYGGTSDFEIKAGELIKYTGASVNVTIPDTVRIIGPKAFKELGIISVSIPKGVETISHLAFAGCNSLTSITISDSVTSIGISAFAGCNSLTSITIPDSVTSIQSGAFTKCKKMTSIEVDKRNSHYSSYNGVLYNKDQTEIICCPKGKSNVTIPNSVTSIGRSAFAGCTKLASITIPGSVTSIAGYAFCNCTSLKSITIPDSVTSIGDSAFDGCTSLKSITIPDCVTSIGVDILKGCPINLSAAKHVQTSTNKSVQALTDNSVQMSDAKPLQTSTNEPAKKEGCYIATAVYGSYDAPEVMTLRRFRDNTLKKSFFGRLFIKVYYTLSPPIAKKLKNAHKINGFVRRILDKWVDKLNRK